jgi:hypothetical protein
MMAYGIGYKYPFLFTVHLFASVVGLEVDYDVIRNIAC